MNKPLPQIRDVFKTLVLGPFVLLCLFLLFFLVTVFAPISLSDLMRGLLAGVGLMFLISLAISEYHRWSLLGDMQIGVELEGTVVESRPFFLHLRSSGTSEARSPFSFPVVHVNDDLDYEGLFAKYGANGDTND